MCLQDLPPELFQIVAEQCDWNASTSAKTDLLQLRSTCRYIESGTRAVWRQAHFSARLVKLCTRQLAKLKDIADVSELATAITELQVRCVDDLLLPDIEPLDPHEPSSSVENLLLQCATSMTMVFQKMKSLDSIPFEVDEDYEHDSFVHCSQTFAAVLSAIQACGIWPREYPSGQKTVISNRAAVLVCALWMP